MVGASRPPGQSDVVRNGVRQGEALAVYENTRKVRTVLIQSVSRMNDMAKIRDAVDVTFGYVA